MSISISGIGAGSLPSRISQSGNPVDPSSNAGKGEVVDAVLAANYDKAKGGKLVNGVRVSIVFTYKADGKMESATVKVFSGDTELTGDKVENFKQSTIQKIKGLNIKSPSGPNDSVETRTVSISIFKTV